MGQLILMLTTDVIITLEFEMIHIYASLCFFHNFFLSPFLGNWVAFPQPPEQRYPPYQMSVVYFSTYRNVRGYYDVCQGIEELPLFFFDFQLPRSLTCADMGPRAYPPPLMDWTFSQGPYKYNPHTHTMTMTIREPDLDAGFAEDVADAPAVAQPLVEGGDDAHEEGVARTLLVLKLPLLPATQPPAKHQHLCGKGGTASQVNSHR